jgi:serine/threonine protein kinase
MHSGEPEFQGTSRFSIERRLGAGGMGVVYQAFDRERQIQVAVKTLKQMSAANLYLFKNEFRSLTDLAHPNLISLYELYHEENLWFFTMEILSGKEFIEHIRDKSAQEKTIDGSEETKDALPETLMAPTLADAPAASAPTQNATAHHYNEESLRSSFNQLVLGVSALHAAQKIHRDIKPSNIMVTENGRVVLMDFGLVKDVSLEENKPNIVGTPLYMAPEQAAGKMVGPEADWYSVGAILYEALTGKPPISGTVRQIILWKQARDPEDIKTLNPAAPEDLASLSMALLRRDPAERPNGKEIMARLGLALGEAHHAGPVSSPSMPSTPFVGRSSALSELQVALSDVKQKKTITFIVEGESGLGKSTLIRHFLASITGDADALVLSGRCYERESVPYKALDGIVDTLAHYLMKLSPEELAAILPKDFAFLLQLFPVLDPLASRPGAPQEAYPPQLRRGRAFHALRELLEKLSASKTLVLFIDDLQWTDKDSLFLLEEILRPPGAPALLLLLATRPQSAPLALPGVVRHTRIEGLPREDAMALAMLLMRETGQDATAIVQEAQGHPLFLQELARYKRGELSEHIKLDDALWTRIQGLPEAARGIVELISVASAPLSQKLIARASALEPQTFVECVASLRASNLVRTQGAQDHYPIESYHDRVRESVLAHLPKEVATRYHQKLAETLEALGTTARERLALVRHLDASGQAERAALYAEQAAETASNALAFDQAAELYRMALRVGRYSPEKTQQLRLTLAETLADAGRGREAAEAFLEVAQVADPTTQLACRRAASEQFLGSGYVQQGLDILRSLLAEIGESLPETQSRALLSMAWNRAQITLRGTHFTPKEEKDILAQDILKIETYRAATITLGMIDYLNGILFQGRWLLLALKSGSAQHATRALCFEALYHATGGAKGTPKAKQLIEEARALSTHTPSPDLTAIVLGCDGAVDVYAGQAKSAEEKLSQSEAILLTLGRGVAWNLHNVRYFRLEALRMMGQWGKLGVLREEYRRDALHRDDRYLVATLDFAFSVLWLVRDDPAQAKKTAAQSLWTPPKGVYLFHNLFQLDARVQTALYEGEIVAAEAELQKGFEEARQSLMFKVQSLRVEILWLQGCSALALALATRGSKASERYQRTATDVSRKLAKEGTLFANIRNGFLSAGLATHQRDKARAIEILNATLSLTEANHAYFLAAVARRRKGELIGGEEGAKLIAKADEAMIAETIQNPARMSQTAAPGFLIE